MLTDLADVIGAYDRRSPDAWRIVNAIVHLKSVETLSRTTASDESGNATPAAQLSSWEAKFQFS